MTDDPRTFDYSSPRRSCDVVMKGGITSGVVYPHAVCELARTYRLCSVGGTSAGAIAAAVAGAAELGRGSGGFAKLAALPSWISSDQHLFELFQPQPRTRRLYRVLTAGLGGGLRAKLRILLAALSNFPLTALAGALLGALLIFAVVRSGDALTVAVGIVAGAVLLVLGILLALGARIVWGLGRAVPPNGFGLCSGLAEGRARPALTPWLAGVLNEFAGRPPDSHPLTFGDLSGGGVNLEFMTTNLTLRRPYHLPWDTREYFFDPDEFRALFPEPVVAWMEAHPPAPRGDESEQREWRLRCELLAPLRPLPDAGDLPVIVATRMSLSFPILLSAVPLWSIDMSRTANQQQSRVWRDWLKQHPSDWEQLMGEGGDHPANRPVAERCWFSDGGISSNFPLQFFDSPVPTRPTFAINLRPFHPDHPESNDEESNVYLPASSGGGQMEWWYRFPETGGLSQLGAFTNAIVRTMQNRVDEAQMRVPGYRDRIAHVGLSETEGGMNLNMPEPVIQRLTTRGALAGRRLVERFAQPPASPDALSWDSHRWTRYRSSLTALSDFVARFRRGYTAPPETDGDPSYAQLSGRDAATPPAAYRWASAGQRQAGEGLTAALVEAAGALDGEPEVLHRRTPKPEPEARVVPKV